MSRIRIPKGESKDGARRASSAPSKTSMSEESKQKAMPDAVYATNAAQKKEETASRLPRGIWRESKKLAIPVPQFAISDLIDMQQEGGPVRGFNPKSGQKEVFDYSYDLRSVLMRSSAVKQLVLAGKENSCKVTLHTFEGGKFTMRLGDLLKLDCNVVANHSEMTGDQFNAPYGLVWPNAEMAAEYPTLDTLIGFSLSK